jgi:hypothetical protein
MPYTDEKDENVTTQEHFEIFKKECLRLWDLWKISGWKLEFRHEDMEGQSQGMAGASSDPTQRCTRIFLSTVWPDHTPVTDHEILLTARHEAIHGLLGPLSTLATSRFVTDNEMCAAEHEVLNVLDGVLPR